MKTKAILILTLLCGVLIPTMQSCQKYSDGPGISLRTRAERVSNTWKVENYKINGTDYTSVMDSYTEAYSKSGSYTYNWDFEDGEGTWSFVNEDREIQLTGNDSHSSRKLTILKLEEDAFWYYYLEGTDKHEVHLVSN